MLEDGERGSHALGVRGSRRDGIVSMGEFVGFGEGPKTSYVVCQLQE